MRFMRWFLFYVILLAVSFVVFLIYLLGAVHHLANHEENTCEMTYMFEYPQYVRVMLDEKIENRYPRYSLYAYGEGAITKRLRRMKFTGIPVLFIPGNAGSHEQVRSLASISLRKSISGQTQFHFDYFTVSLAKDYSALYGGVLMDQTIYVSHCIKKILSLYNGKYDKVVLIGHSMGGIVAKAAISLVPTVGLSSANILITIAAPHKPALIFDKKFADFYDSIDSLKSNLTDAGVTIISIGGGHKDKLVNAAQAIDQYANISTLSTSIPGVWKSTDHLCSLWCKQFILAIIRALFDCVEISPVPPRISNNPTKNVEIFSYHLINKYYGKRYMPHSEKMTFENAAWLEKKIDQGLTWTGNSIFTPKLKDVTVFLTVPLPETLDTIIINSLNLKTKDWIFACSPKMAADKISKCKDGWNLTNKTSQLADLRYDLRKVVSLDVKQLKKLGATHIAVRMEPNDRKDVVLNFDLHLNNTRITNKVFYESDFVDISRYLPWTKSASVIKIKPGELRHYVNLTKTPNAISWELKKVTCDNDTEPASALVELIEPWNPTITKLMFFTKSDNGPKVFKIQKPAPLVNNSVWFRVTVDTPCEYTFELKEASTVEQMSVLVRDRWPVLYQISIALLILSISLKIDSDRFTTVGITVFVTCAAMEVHVECCVMVFLLHLMAVGICCSVIFLGSIVHKFASRFLARAIAFSVTWSEWLIGGLNQLPICTTVIVLSMVPATCGALAMIVSVFLYYLRLTHMYDDYLEELLLSTMRHFRILKPKKDDDVNEDTRIKILNHLIVFMLLCFAAVPAVPSVLVWAKNFSVSTKLNSEDPILMYSWIVIIVCSMMDLIKIPTVITLRSQILAYILCVVSWIILYLASIQNIVYHQWWMPPFVAFSVVAISLNALIP